VAVSLIEEVDNLCREIEIERKREGGEREREREGEREGKREQERKKGERGEKERICAYC